MDCPKDIWKWKLSLVLQVFWSSDGGSGCVNNNNDGGDGNVAPDKKCIQFNGVSALMSSRGYMLIGTLICYLQF
jgi:hypothetical protein